MSNAIQYDPLLVHYLARELNQRLRGRACAAAPLFTAERGVVLPLDRGEALSLDLHPLRGWIRILPWDAGTEELDAVCTGVEAPPDERVLRIGLHATERFRALTRQLVVELHTNQWNAMLVSEADERILSVLWSRTAGGRALHAGQTYRPPQGEPRFGVAEPLEVEARAEWRLRIGAEAPGARRRALLSGFAFTGGPNARALLGDAAEVDDASALWRAFDRWWALRRLPPPEPVVIRLPDRSLPYPVPLPDTPSERVESLLHAMARIAEAGGAAADGATEAQAPGVAAIRRRMEGVERRVERLEAQLAKSGEAQHMRLWGDLLLARKRLVPHGADRVRLQDWEGKLVEVPLDPTLSATDNADRWYDEARKRERADARLPELLQAARAEASRWRAALAEAERGSVPQWVEEALGAEAAERSDAPPEPSRPYRRYRTSGGLEVRVGKSARDNDQLTFAHSSPNDVWLHARSVAGSHVILRWRDPEAAPPARDLGEAATLAALYSKARSSGLVPVDWTRRKHVRKPRGAPPGSVVPQQVRTLLVEPDPAVEERLRLDYA